MKVLSLKTKKKRKLNLDTYSISIKEEVSKTKY